MEDRLVVCAVSDSEGNVVGYGFRVRGASSDEQAFWRIVVYFATTGGMPAATVGKLVNSIRRVVPPEEMPPGEVIELGPDY
jgi:hypothetical protein